MEARPAMPLPLKALSQHAIPRALEKAERYRLLNEPVAAESICLDVLAVDPNNQTALVMLLLSLTDQFGQGFKLGGVQPKEILQRLTDPYDRAYYAGIVAERQAQAALRQDAPHAAHIAHDLLEAAMRHYEAAADIRRAGNDDALLRWNTCARLMDSQGVHPRADDAGDDSLE
jgi:hypothetical protein